MDFPGAPDGRKSACNAGDPGLIPASERSFGEGNGNPLQYPNLGNPMDKEPWWVQGIAKRWTQMSRAHWKKESDG